MHSITSTKLQALAEQRDAFETKKQSILAKLSEESEPRQRVGILLDALSSQNLSAWDITGLSTDNLRRFLDQSRNDPSVSASLLHDWEDKLKRSLDVKTRQYDHAKLFGRLVTEWLENPNEASIDRNATSKTTPSHDPETMSVDSASGSESSFEQVGRAEMHEQRKEWESIVFKPQSRSDSGTITEYLTKLFGSTLKSKKLTKTPLENLRERMKSVKGFGDFDIPILKSCIKGLLKTDLLSAEKRRAVTDLRDNDAILNEFSDVLNMQLDTLDSWSWGNDAVPMQMRRHLNGKYRVYMDEEILQALLIHFIGKKWAVLLKEAFQEFFNSGAWKLSSVVPLTRRARERRNAFLGESRNPQSVRNLRREKYQEKFFMTQLPSAFDEESREYGVFGEDEDEETEKDFKSPLVIKQSLFHLLSTELLLNTSLYGSFTVVQSDFKWFGPSLPHKTIFAVLEFFRVPEKWLKFFRTFLEAPLRFAQDGPYGRVQIRTGGVPIQHVLSDALGEAVLFCLDFAVNQATEANMYRFHDDLWFWGQEQKVVDAWKTMKNFSAVMGLTLSEDKSGAVQILTSKKPAKVAGSLPQGQIKWGFLKMDPTGAWVIDNEQINEHIEELRLQLQQCKSVFAWVQAWNVYVTKFFSTNFGAPAQCLGRKHVDMVIETFSRIQRTLFEHNDPPCTSANEYLRDAISNRFKASDIPDGFFYFPIELGGLELRNPLIPLLLVRESAYEEPRDVLTKALEQEELAYEKGKEKYEEGSTCSRSNTNILKPDEPFMDFDEYSRYYEETSGLLGGVYTDLMEKPQVENIKYTLDAAKFSNFRDMSSYDKWVAQLYGEEVVKRFGGSAMGEKRLLPVGLAGMLRGEKVRWHG